jgi:HEAT repeat protein
VAGCESTSGEADDADAALPMGQAITDLIQSVMPRPPHYWLDILRTSSNPDDRRLAYQHLSDPELYGDDAGLRGRMVKVFTLALDTEVEGAVVRAAVAQALGRFALPEAQKALDYAMRDSSPLVRAEAARSMAAIRQPGGCESLGTAVLADTDSDVRMAAASGLARFPMRGAVESLIAALADRSVVVVHCARGSLAALTGQRFGDDQTAWRADLNSRPADFPKTLAEALQRESQKQAAPSKTFLLF